MITKGQIKKAGLKTKDIAAYLCMMSANAMNDDSSIVEWYDMLWNPQVGYSEYTLDDCISELDEDMTIQELEDGIKNLGN